MRRQIWRLLLNLVSGRITNVEVTYNRELMKPTQPIDRPIFILGCGRSGTTILYNILCGHPDLAWFSNYTERFPGFPYVAKLSWLYQVEMLRKRRPKGLPVPSEAHKLWDRCKPVEQSPGDRPLTEKDAGTQDKRLTEDVIRRYLSLQRKSRFINKNTRNTRRVRYLNQILPDALFIHIIRDPRASVASFMNVPFWPELKVWCHDGITPNEHVANGGDAIELATQLWVAEVSQALEDKKCLASDRYLEIRYEDLMATPRETIAGVMEFCDLDWNPTFDRVYQTFSMRNMNHKFRSQFDRRQLETIERIACPLALDLGYAISSKPSDAQAAQTVQQSKA